MVSQREIEVYDLKMIFHRLSDKLKTESNLHDSLNHRLS